MGLTLARDIIHGYASPRRPCAELYADPRKAGRDILTQPDRRGLLI
jgi:hypothetical protein